MSGQLQEEEQGYGGKQEQEKLDDYEAQDEGGRTSSVQTSYVSVLDQVSTFFADTKLVKIFKKT